MSWIRPPNRLTKSPLRPQQCVSSLLYACSVYLTSCIYSSPLHSPFFPCRDACSSKVVPSGTIKGRNSRRECARNSNSLNTSCSPEHCPAWSCGRIIGAPGNHSPTWRYLRREAAHARGRTWCTATNSSQRSACYRNRIE